MIDVENIDYTIPIYNRKDIIDNTDWDNEDDKLICEDIIDKMDEQIRTTIVKGQTAQIPYIGNIRKNPVHMEFTAQKSSLSELRKQVGKAEYKKQISKLIIDIKANCKTQDYIHRYFNSIKRNNLKKYNKLFNLLGQHYADLYIYSIMWCKEVPFDQDVEDAYNMISNDG